jgi:purine-nucleoside phosphorylase
MDSKLYIDHIHRACAYIREITGHDITETAVILGTGLGDWADSLEDKVVISYSDIPYFPASTVEGHSGRMIFGLCRGKRILAMQGRIHYYEGYSMAEVSFPVRIMQFLGIKQMIVTNASGGLNPAYKVGDLVVITDHINLMGANPLIGMHHPDLGVRFPDMSGAYDKGLTATLKSAFIQSGKDIKTGVYAAVSGPCYESPAEAAMLRVLGADMVGMSTVPEVIAAVHGGIKVAGVSCVTDMPGSSEEGVTHQEVVEVAEKAGARLGKILNECMALLS